MAPMPMKTDQLQVPGPPTLFRTLFELSTSSCGLVSAGRQTVTPRRHLSALCLFALFATPVWLAGCDNHQTAARALPPARVTVSKPVYKQVVNWSEFTGRTAAVNLVNV